MPRFWFSDVTVTRLRLRVRTVSCAWWNVPGLLRSMTRVFGIRGGVRRSVLNAAAARSYLPRTIKKTDLILAGRTKAQMIQAIAAAIDKKELPPMELGAMCYMLSKQGHLSDRDGHWHPHLMFFVSQTDPAAWGAGVQGSPILAFNDTWEHLTTFLVPVRQWSDGTADR